MRKILINLLLILSLNISAQEILSLKDRAEVIMNLQKDRLDNLLPSILLKND